MSITPMLTTRAAALIGLALQLATPACVSEDVAGEGSVALEMSGGAALRDGFPHTEGGATHAFVDGWELTFDKYVIAVGDVRFSEQGSDGAMATWAGPKIMDLASTDTGAEALTTVDGLPARRLDFGFSFVVPTELPATSTAADEDVQAMIDNGWSFLVAGEAIHPDSGRIVRFELGLPVAARYYECINGKDTTLGVAIEANKTTGAFIYAHGIHLFWDTLAAGDEDLRFEAFAAVAGDDGVVTSDDLALQDLTDLRDADGAPLLDEDGHRVIYDDGGLLPPAEWTLYGFVKHAARASAHFNGVGLCRVESL